MYDDGPEFVRVECKDGADLTSTWDYNWSNLSRNVTALLTIAHDFEHLAIVNFLEGHQVGYNIVVVDTPVINGSLNWSSQE